MAYIRLDSLAFEHNLNTISHHIASTIQSAPELALVLKDNAYGHGLTQIASLAHSWGIQSVFVKNYAEAMQIYELFPIITTLYGEVPYDAPSNIWHSIASLAELEAMLAWFPDKACGYSTQAMLKNSPQEVSKIPSIPYQRTIELKVNIGMNRNGLAADELDSALMLLERSPHIRLGGVFAHNGYGDNDDRGFMQSIQRFYAIKQRVLLWSERNHIPRPRFHSLSTSGALRFYAQQRELCKEWSLDSALFDDIVRIGIGAYGYHTSDVPLHIQLRPVASLWAKKISSLFLKKGERIGYGGVSKVRKDGVFSTYDVGYGDGLFRLSGSEGRLFCASGEEILPIMSMDNFSCQSEKKEICVFDDVREWAQTFRTIPYVILTHLSPFLPRVVV